MYTGGKIKQIKSEFTFCFFVCFTVSKLEM